MRQTWSLLLELVVQVGRQGTQYTSIQANPVVADSDAGCEEGVGTACGDSVAS